MVIARARDPIADTAGRWNVAGVSFTYPEPDSCSLND